MLHGTSSVEEAVAAISHEELARQAARKSALRHLVDTFFDGSSEQAVAALLGGEGARLTDEQLDRIAAMIAKARKEGGE